MISLPTAHLRPEDGVKHSLAKHLEGTAERAALFAAPWGAGEVARLAGLWHDLGKFAPEFQEMIASANPEAHLEDVPDSPKKRVNHSSAGALWAIRHFEGMGEKGLGRVLSYAIAGHHAGLPDWIREDGGGRGLFDRMRENSHLDRALSVVPPDSMLRQAKPSHARAESSAAHRN